MLMQCIDSLVQKVQSGVVINFEKIGPDPPSIDGVNSKDGEPDEVNHEPEKEMDVDGDRNGVRICQCFLKKFELTAQDHSLYSAAQPPAG